MDTTPNLNLPYIMPSQAQKHVTHNEAIRELDALLQLSVLSRTVATPPSSPVDGERYLVAENPTGDWQGRENTVAAFQDGSWFFYPPLEGWMAWVSDEDVMAAWDGSSWTVAGGSIGEFNTVSINGAAADATNRIAANAPATLLNHDGNGHQLKINKNAAGDTASVLFQTSFSGRAEFGLTGDDNWHVKVSADGSSWREALFIDKSTGRVGFGTTSPECVIHGEYSNDAADQSAVIRNTSTNAAAQVRFSLQRGADAGTGLARGSIIFVTGVSMGFGDWEARTIKLFTGTTPGTSLSRIDILPGGNVGIGTGSPTAKLHVDGPVRVKSYTVAGVPSASANGAGSIIFVTDETGGGVLAFSDGTNWRRSTDRAIVS